MKDPENPEVLEFGLNLAGEKIQFPLLSQWGIRMHLKR
jgi:hypothetical protein